MSFVGALLGRGKSVATQQTAAVGLQVQTSVQGKPIPLVYGVTRIAPNLIWYGNFQSQQQSSGAGKGGLTGAGGKGGGSGNYTYSTSFEAALCEGPIVEVLNVYADKAISTPPQMGLSIFSGAYQQSPWSYLLAQQGLVSNELHTIPASSPYTVTTNQSFLYDEGVTITTGVPLIYTSNGSAVQEGYYHYVINYSSVTYTFNSADNGKSVLISYTENGVPGTYLGTVSGRTVTVPNVLGYLYRDQGVVYITGVPLTKVSGSPASGQYAESAGIYTFNSAQAGQNVFIDYVPNNGTSQALGYSGIAYAAAANYALGNNPSLPNFNFEVAGKFAGEVGQQIQGEQYTLPLTAPFVVTVRFPAEWTADDGVTDQAGNVYTKVSSSPGTNQYTASAGVYTFSGGNAGAIVNISYSASAGPDADPSAVLTDLLTNPHYGVGFPSDRVGDLSTYQSYCLASGLVISPAYTTQTAAASMLDDIAKATNSEFVWSSGVLTLVPYGDQAITANGHTYTPPGAPEYALTDDDFMPNTNATASSAAVNQDPVLMTRKRPADKYNDITLEWLDRGNNYSPALIEAKDEASITAYGLRKDATRSFHMFCNGNAARISVQLQLQRQSICNIYQFTLDQRYVLLDPMDIVAITDTSLGIVDQWVRIREITENDDSTLSIVAEEYQQGTGTAPLYSYQQGQGFYANYNADPGDTNIPVLFEPPAELSEALSLWMAASGGNMWGGCDVYVSQDGGESYTKVGQITGPSRQGYVDAVLPSITRSTSGLTIDTSNTLAADISLSGGQLLSVTQSGAQSLATLSYLGSGNGYELLAFETATLLSQNFYDLTYLVRGAYGSAIATHQIGEQFARLDGSIFEFDYTQDKIGQQVYIKLPAFNIYGGGQQNLADVDPYTFTLQGIAYSTPLPDIQNLRTSYVANITQLMWDEVQDFRPVQYEIRKGSAWNGAQVLGRVAHPPFNVQGNGTYWVAAYSQPVPGLQVYSLDPQDIDISGAQIVSNVIASWDEGGTGWTGTFGGAAGLEGTEVTLTGAGNILDDPDYLGTPNIFAYGGIGSVGTYTIPDAHIINIGRVAPCSVIINWQSVGQHISDNVLAISDYLNFQDLLDTAAQVFVNVYPNISTSQDGSTWSDWQKWTPGSYNAMAFKAQMQLETSDPTVQAILESFIFEVDVPDRDDHYVNLALSSAGTSITFTPDGSMTPAPFNGGPQGSPSDPAIQVTILGAQAGDDAIISGVSLAGCTVEVKNGGLGVARNVNVLAQGY